MRHNQSSPHSLQLEKILCSNKDPAQLINKLKKKDWDQMTALQNIWGWENESPRGKHHIGAIKVGREVMGN